MCKKVKKTGLKSEQVNIKNLEIMQELCVALKHRPTENGVKSVLEWLSSTTSAMLMHQPAELPKNEDRLKLSRKKIWQG